MHPTRLATVTFRVRALRRGTVGALVSTLLLLWIPGGAAASAVGATLQEPRGLQETRGRQDRQAPQDQQDSQDRQDPASAEPQGPARTEETVRVTATRVPARLADMPTAVRLVTADRLRSVPALVLDDALRWIPSFSLFRRTSSLAAHPTAQGLNLRGLGPSGVSRALVLVDGVPMNDPFGGWVYWDRVPLLALEQVEVAPGGGSAPYGSHALGGVVQLLTRRAEGTGLRLQAVGGDHATSRVGAAVGLARPGLGLLAAGEIFHTGGYVAVAPAERGAVDTEVASSHQSLRLRLDADPGFWLTLEGLRERRGNGTPLQRNDTLLGGAAGGWRREAPASGLQLHGFFRSQRFDSTFTAVADDRNGEIPVLQQRVPSTDVGAGGHGWLEPGRRAIVSIGGDWRRMAGHSKEDVLLAGFSRAPGGIQHLGGGFGAVDVSGERWSASLALRADGWRQQPVETAGETRTEATLSPRAGVVWHPGPGWSVRGAGYRAFRAPTLNELYRQFRVGDVVTRENPELEEERLRGFEVGASWAGRAADPVTLEVETTFYWNRLENAVVNATEEIVDGLTLRRRRNLGSVRARGLELFGRVGLYEAWSVTADAAWLDSRVADDPELEGNRLPQVPEYRARGTVRWAGRDGWSALLSVAATGVQFEDDLNRLPLAAAVTLDGALELPLGDRLSLTLRGENLLDHEVQEKRTPTLTLGPPRTLYAGFTATLGR